jgi:hypothetical protein
LRLALSPALAVNLLLEKYIPLVRDLDKTSSSVFWIRTLILTALVYFGYQTVSLPRLASKAARERLQDALFGAVLGGLNGYFIAGTVLYYNHVANYPYSNIISRGNRPGYRGSYRKNDDLYAPALSRRAGHLLCRHYHSYLHYCGVHLASNNWRLALADR